MDIIPVFIDGENVLRVGPQDRPNGIAFHDRRNNVERRDSLPADANHLFELFGRAVYKHMREHRINITYTTMLDHEDALMVSEDLKPLLQALWKVWLP